MVVSVRQLVVVAWWWRLLLVIRRLLLLVVALGETTQLVVGAGRRWERGRHAAQLHTYALSVLGG